MKFLTKLPLYFALILVFSLTNCDRQSSNLNTETTPNQELIPSPYPNFSNFPIGQFKTLKLGEDLSKIQALVADMAVKKMAEQEVAHFYFPSDSTELIIPDQPVMNEFKVFLRSRIYLDDPIAFSNFLKETAAEEHQHDNFPVYYYETEDFAFKLTLFQQSTFIRIHFILTQGHG